jgi:hypothetical protein
MKRFLAVFMILALSACTSENTLAFAPTSISMQTPASTATVPPLATSTWTAISAGTSAPTLRPARTETPSLTAAPVFTEGDVFPAGDLELRVTTQRAKIMWYPEKILPIDCRENQKRICLAVKVEVISGRVAGEAMSGWRINWRKTTDIQWTGSSVGSKMLRNNPDGSAAYGYWVLYIEPDAGDLILQIQESHILVKDSPILEETVME